MGNAQRHSLQLFKPHTPRRWHPEGTAVLTTPQYKCHNVHTQSMIVSLLNLSDECAHSKEGRGH